MIISVDVEEAFDKIPHSFMIKMRNRLELKGDFLTLTKGIYKNTAANLVLNGE